MRAVRNVLGNVYLSSLTKNLWYEEREQLDSGGEGALSQGLKIFRSLGPWSPDPQGPLNM